MFAVEVDEGAWPGGYPACPDDLVDLDDGVVGVVGEDDDDAWRDFVLGLEPVPAPARPGLALGAWLEDSLTGATFPPPSVDEDGDAVREAESVALTRVRGRRRMTGWCQALEMREIAAMADRALARTGAGGSRVADADMAMTSLCCELALAWRVSGRTATARVAEAVSLVRGVPLSVQFLAEGRVDMAHVRGVADVVCALDPDVGAQVEAEVLAGAERDGATPAKLRAAARRAAVRVDPAAAEKLRQEKRRQRSVSLSAEDGGMATLAAHLPAEQAHLLYGTVDEHARRLSPVDPADPRTPRSMDARRTDALVDLVALGAVAATAPTGGAPSGCIHDECGGISRGGPTTGDSPSGDPAETRPADGADPVDEVDDQTETDGAPGRSGPCSGSSRSSRRTGRSRERRQRPDRASSPGRAAGCTRCTGGARRGPAPPRTEVRVVVGADTLLGLDDHPGELVGHGPITAGHARELAAAGSATWRRVLTDPRSGTVLDVGTTRYRPPAAMAEHVRTRDVECGFPGCRVPARVCDLDHVAPFDPENGTGPTAAVNLWPACRRHHVVKHLPGWSARLVDDATVLEWTTPLGNRYRTPRPPLLGRDG